VLSIELQTPASTVVIPVIRVVAADLAARADFEVDSVEPVDGGGRCLRHAGPDRR
jgi:hypothetical protein